MFGSIPWNTDLADTLWWLTEVYSSVRAARSRMPLRQIPPVSLIQPSP